MVERKTKECTRRKTNLYEMLAPLHDQHSEKSKYSCIQFFNVYSKGELINSKNFFVLFTTGICTEKAVL